MCWECGCFGHIFGYITLLAGAFYMLRKYVAGGKCHSKARIDGKTVIITGANTGIGKETAVDMAIRGAIVIMACRDKARGETALKDVKERTKSSTVYLKILDLASLSSIRRFSEEFLAEYNHLHILINNAGIMNCPQLKTEDGFEMQIGVNHFGHFALTNLLLKKLVECSPSRIVNVSSGGHKGMFGQTPEMNFVDINLDINYEGIKAYVRSKLANIMFTRELNRKIAHTGVTTYVLHPGVIMTELGRYFSPSFKLFSFFTQIAFKTPMQGAQTTIYCAVQEGLEDKSGLYFSDCDVNKPSKLSQDDGMAKKLWELSEEMTQVKFPLSSSFILKK